MKRSLPQHNNVICRNDNDATILPLHYDLGSCLKRVRISMSPGELRLDRDLSDLEAHWTQVDDRVFLCRDARLERTNDPLRLVLRVKNRIELHLAFSRMYPHSPPLVTRVWSQENSSSDSCRIKQVVVTMKAPEQQQQQHEMQQDHEVEMFKTINFCTDTTAKTADNTLVYDQWTPIQQFGNLLDFLVTAFRQDHSDHATLSDDNTEQDVDMQLNTTPTKATFLPPNRFNVGYDQQRRSTFMEYENMA